MLRRFVASALVAVLLAPAAACWSSREDALVGTWRQIDGSEVLQFFAGGEVIQEDSGGSIGAAFRFIDDTHIRVDFGGPAAYAPPRTFRVEVGTDTLELTDEKNVIKRYRRTEKSPTLDPDPR